jgi:hypothetical protein
MELATIVKQAERTLLHEGRHLPIVLVAFEGLPALVPCPLSPFPATPEQRQYVMFLKGKQLADQYSTQRVQRLWFISEAWMRDIRLHPQNDGMPARPPKRQEVLLILELDASTPELAQQIALRAMRRTRTGKLKGMHPIDEIASANATVTLMSVAVLAFLAGFAEACTDPHAYGPVYTKMVWQKLQMERLPRNYPFLS